MLREAMARRLYRRAVAEGQITLPAVPGLLDEYLTMCQNLFAGLGIRYTAEQSAQLKAVLQRELEKAFRASSRSNIVISFDTPFGTGLNYHVKAEVSTIAVEYDHWVATRDGPLFGTEPDARVLALAGGGGTPPPPRGGGIRGGGGRRPPAAGPRAPP